MFLITDEVYREFTYDGHKHHSIMAIEGLENHAIMIDSVSKRYSMCGARIGCMVTKNKSVRDTALKFMGSTLSPPTYAQIASEAALDTPNSCLENVREYVERRNVLIQELQNIEGVKVATPKGAFYCIVELPFQTPKLFAQWLPEKFRVDNATIMIAPAEFLYHKRIRGKSSTNCLCT